MKRLTGFLMALALTVFAASCLKPESERMPEVLQISAKNTDKLNPFQAQISVTVKCDLNWKAELKDSTWGSIRVQSLQKGKGGEFVVLLKDNLAEEDRSNTIIVKAGKGDHHDPQADSVSWMGAGCRLQVLGNACNRDVRRDRLGKEQPGYYRNNGDPGDTGTDR